MKQTDVANFLAHALRQHAEKLSEEPFAGHGAEWTELGEQLAKDAVVHLHLFLTLHPDAVPEAKELIEATASWEAWQEYGS